MARTLQCVAALGLRARVLVISSATASSSNLVVEPRDPIGDETITSFADRVRADTKPCRYHRVAGFEFAGKDDLRPQRQRRGQRARPRDGQNIGAFRWIS